MVCIGPPSLCREKAVIAAAHIPQAPPDGNADLAAVYAFPPGNFRLVIKTISGSAHVAAEAVDSLRWPEVLGTIAGDNTILVIVRTNEEVDVVIRRFRNIVK